MEPEQEVIKCAGQKNLLQNYSKGPLLALEFRSLIRESKETTLTTVDLSSRIRILRCSLTISSTDTGVVWQDYRVYSE